LRGWAATSLFGFPRVFIRNLDRIVRAKDDPCRGRLALASRAADGVSAGIPIVPVDPQLLQALVKSIVSCLGTAPGLPVSHFPQIATTNGDDAFPIKGDRVTKAPA